MGNSDTTFFKFSIPKNDEITRDWLTVQQNKSTSMRLAIHLCAAIYGYSDLTCVHLLPTDLKGLLTQVIREACEDGMITEAVHVPVTNVSNEQHEVYEVHEEHEESDTSVVSTGSVSTANSSVAALETDDDGFIDPEELLGIK